MKRLSLALVLLLALLMSVVACGDEQEETYTEIDYSELSLSDYVKLGQYKSLEIKVDPIQVNAYEIDKSLKAMIEKETTLEEYPTPITDRATEAGDYVEINFKAYFDGELYEAGSANGVAIMLAEDNGYFDWMDDDLYGVMPGTTVETTGTLPEDSSYYGEYTGKEGTFVITVVSIKAHYTIPELTDAFIAERTEYDTVEAYRTAMYETMVAEATEIAEQERMALLWHTVLDSSEVLQYPEQQVMYYYTNYKNNILEEAAIYGHSYEEHLEAVGLTDEYVMEGSRESVKEELVFYAIVQAENYSISDEEYAEGIIEYAERQGMSVEQFEQQYGKEYIKDNLLWDKVMYALKDMTAFTVVYE